MMTGMILIDLQRAFDKIGHKLLLLKLNAIGSLSFISPTFIGIPLCSSGFYFRRFLLLIYVSDIRQAVECHLFLYANDTCLVCQHKDIN